MPGDSLQLLEWLQGSIITVNDDILLPPHQNLCSTMHACNLQTRSCSLGESLWILNETPCTSICEILNHRLTNKILFFFSPNLNSSLSLPNRPNLFTFECTPLTYIRRNVFIVGSAAVCLHFDSQGGLLHFCLHLDSPGGLNERVRTINNRLRVLTNCDVVIT